MLLGFKNFTRLLNAVAVKCELQSTVENENLLKSVINNFSRGWQKQSFHTNTPRMKDEAAVEIRHAAKASKAKENLTAENLNSVNTREKDLIPPHNLAQNLYNGVPFADIPIVVVSCSRNNTKMTLSDKGVTKLNRSCGVEGFKNARKGTNLAGQATGVSFAMRALKKGYKTVRLLFRGLGPGRVSGAKGLQLGGLNIISVTDDTTDSSSNRPRKKRRL